MFKLSHSVRTNNFKELLGNATMYMYRLFVLWDIDRNYISTFLLVSDD